jgi:hypothetical protein
LRALGLFLSRLWSVSTRRAIRFPLADRLSDRSGPFIVFAHDDQNLHGRMVQRDKARKGSCQDLLFMASRHDDGEGQPGAIDTAPVTRCFERGRPLRDLRSGRGNTFPLSLSHPEPSANSGKGNWRSSGTGERNTE